MYIYIYIPPEYTCLCTYVQEDRDKGTNVAALYLPFLLPSSESSEKPPDYRPISFKMPPNQDIRTFKGYIGWSKSELRFRQGPLHMLPLPADFRRRARWRQRRHLEQIGLEWSRHDLSVCMQRVCVDVSMYIYMYIYIYMSAYRCVYIYISAYVMCGDAIR